MQSFSFISIRICCFFTAVSLAFCSNGRQKGSESQITPETGINTYAKRYTLIHRDGYSQLIIKDPWQGAGGVVQQWYLIREGNKIPEGIKPGQTISVPVKKIICMSTTHLAMISALKEYNSVKGFSGVSYIYDPVFTGMVKDGAISETGYEDNLNKELVLKIKPDLVVAYGIGAESAGYIAKLRELGMKVMFNADYLEEDPLGKTEWIRVFGALYNKDHLADSIFASVERNYNGIKSLVRREAKTKPEILLGLPFRDTWYISPGNSYISRLMEDAGGKYLWSDSRSSYALPLSIEAVYLKALSADFWLNTGTVTTASEISAMDSRLAALPAFREGHIFNNNNRVNKNGGNDYWEGGCMNPDIILKDVASLIHPGLFPGWELFYYRKIN